MPKFTPMFYVTGKENTIDEPITTQLNMIVVHNEDWSYSLDFPRNLYNIPRLTHKRQKELLL